MIIIKVHNRKTGMDAPLQIDVPMPARSQRQANSGGAKMATKATTQRVAMGATI
ncbi:hypothetical protein VAWG004_31380 [Aeromonas veronii]|nr:hypothetical protein VAWG004_31380 [Aeromonas veronii]